MSVSNFKNGIIFYLLIWKVQVPIRQTLCGSRSHIQHHLFFLDNHDFYL